MSKECVISLKFSAPADFSKTKSGVVIAVILFCLFPVKLGSETLTLTTYYPAPYGGYASILTTGRTLLARDGDNVGIGTTSPMGPSPTNGLAGNLYVNDIYLRARSEWVSDLPKFTTYRAGAAAGLTCLRPDETLISGGCKAGWEFSMGPWNIGWCPICVTIPKIEWNFVANCGTQPNIAGNQMWFFYPFVPPTRTWITCVINR